MGLKDNLKKIQDQENEFDTQKEINKWTQAVDDFYKDIEIWFKDLIDEGLMKLKTEPRQTYEEMLGDYTINDLEISLGNRTVMLEPFGTMLIGAWGAIDMYMRGMLHDKKVILRIRDEKDKEKFYWAFRKKTNNFKFEYDVINKEMIEKIFEEWTS